MFLTVWLTPTETGRDAEPRFPPRIELDERLFCRDVGLTPCPDYAKYPNKHTACAHCNNRKNGEAVAGDPSVVTRSPGLYGQIRHWNCRLPCERGRGPILPSGVICGKCCIDLPSGYRSVTRCKCATPRDMRDDDDDDDNVGDWDVPDYDL